MAVGPSESTKHAAGVEKAVAKFKLASEQDLGVSSETSTGQKRASNSCCGGIVVVFVSHDWFPNQQIL